MIARQNLRRPRRPSKDANPKGQVFHYHMLICNQIMARPLRLEFAHALYDNQILIAIFRKLAIIASMNSKQTKTLKAIFAKPVARNIKFSEIEALVIALGGEVREGDGSRVALLLGGGAKHAHRPHPGKEAKQYQIKEIRDWLTAIGVKV